MFTYLSEMSCCVCLSLHLFTLPSGVLVLLNLGWRSSTSSRLRR